MKLFCLLRNCQWRSLLVCEVAGLHCQCCERSGALRYSQPGHPSMCRSAP
ncbi:PSPA7_2676 family Cys-rich small protein [Pseudomonas sp. S37]|nr:PSPA7_2676 family Cys-rich small protein [Pseudomonas sp. S37]